MYQQKINWKMAWASAGFRKITGTGVVVLALAASGLPFFFAWIESRQGARLQDAVLQWLIPTDHSGLIFSLIWGMVALALYRCWKDPVYFLHLLIGYDLLLLSRYITITVFPLEPPEGWIELKDPITNLFYGGGFITRDLFYSGHTATMWLIVFSAATMPLAGRLAGFGVSLLVGFLVMKQHVHYTIDVLAAPFFAWGASWVARQCSAAWQRKAMG